MCIPSCRSARAPRPAASAPPWWSPTSGPPISPAQAPTARRSARSWRCRTWPRAPGRSPSCWPTPPTLPRSSTTRRPSRTAPTPPQHPNPGACKHPTPRRRSEHVTAATYAREDTDPYEHLSDASERLNAALANVAESPLYALGALADVRVNVDAAILILVRQLRLARPPASWEAIGDALG